MNPVIPILTKGTIDTLDKIDAQVWHLIIFSLSNPGNTSELHEESMLSFRKLAARFGKNRDKLASEYAARLGQAIAQYDPTLKVVIEANERDETTYTISIAVLRESGEAILNADNIVISEDGTTAEIDLTNIK